MAGPRAAATCCHALLGALNARALQLRRCYHFVGASTPRALLAVLAALVCGSAAFPRAVAFFLPLVASTSLFCAAACLFAASESEDGRSKAVEVVLVRGEGKPEAGLLQVFGDANASAYGRGDVQVGCFLRRRAQGPGGGGWAERGVGEDGEEVVFAGRLEPRAGGARHGHHQLLEEELVSLRVDRLAEGVWNSYFGGSSTWNDVDPATSCS